jgi:chromosome segregation ATPase
MGENRKGKSMSRTYDAVAKEFAALDLSDLNERLTIIAKQRGEAEEAERVAEARCTEIAHAIREWKGADPAAIADALVQGDQDRVSRFASDISDLEAEKANLRAGIGELRRRIRDSYDAENKVKSEARSRIGPLSDPLMDEMRVEAENAAQALLRIWTIATAISRSSYASNAERLAGSLQETVSSLTSHPGLLAKQVAYSYPVPDEIVALLQPLTSKGEAFRNGVMLQVSSPHGDRATFAQSLSHRRSA